MRKSISLVDLTILLALACVAVVGYKLSPLLLAKSDLTLDAVSGCDLNLNSCATDLPGGGRVELAITPRPIPLVKPLQVDVRVDGVSVERVDIDFAGVSMAMGYNRQSLTPSGDGRYRGSAMLPVCVSGRMDWQATLLIDAGGRRIAVPFHFAAPAE